MSERILRALMQLFALVAKDETGGDSGRKVVKVFLEQQLNKELVLQYLEVFDQFFIEYHGGPDEQDEKKKKRISRSSVKVLKICMAINAELTQKQKVIVLFRLLEFVNSDGSIDGQELDFVNTVSESFNVDDQEFLRCLHFVKASSEDQQDSGNVLIISNNREFKLERAHHIYADALHGQIRVLRIPSVNLYVFRYFGTETLFINGQPVRSDRINLLSPGASIRTSGLSPIYYSDIVGSFMRATVDHDLVFEVDAIEYFFPGGKQGLHTLSTREDSGQLLGIMGASGAGKSTLLNILNGTAKPTKGAVKINGIDIYEEPDKVKGLIGYISQDDLLIEDLTVFENLYYNAKLCFEGVSDFKLTRMVMTTLKNLGLGEIKDLKVGSPLNKKISGGQRKRLNIALELIREPSILFVDEPTSGLSSRDSENIMDLLKELALKGKLVYVVIHQPSSDIYKMFDKLLILDTGGFPVYYGNPIDAIGYFKSQINDVTSQDVECFNCGNVNPEQVFNIIEGKVLDEYGQLTQSRRVKPAEWNDKFLSSGKMEAELADSDASGGKLPEVASIPSRIAQFLVFLTRDVRAKWADKQYMLINFLETPVLALILASLVRFYANDEAGYLFRENDNIPAYMFMCVVVALFFGLTVSAEEIIKDRKILKREKFLNLSRSSYLVSKIIIMFFISLVQTLSFVLIGNAILEVQGMNMAYFLVLFSTSCFANMLGLNISASFRNAVTIYILIPFLIIPQLLLSGVIVEFDKLNPGFSSNEYVPITGEIMASKWAYEALAVHQFKSNEYQSGLFDFEKTISEATFRKDYWIPELKKKIITATSIIDLESEPDDKKASLLRLIRHEIERENAFNPENRFEKVDQLTLEAATPELLIELRGHLDRLSKYYVKERNAIDSKKDHWIASKVKTPEEREVFNKLRDDYYNESLGDLVMNSTDFYRIIERDDKLIQRLHPIYQDPTGSSMLRSHFFAPRKMFFGHYVDTYWANIIVIWSMSIFLMLTLYFDALTRLLEFFGNLTEKLPFRHRN
ncbi:MAG: ATP-binding cassette domain-containing protein [Flavobacteriales bacterium]|nr:ATP-binding cassette domain-containing protein [Flavobacteriales bacterium]